MGRRLTSLLIKSDSDVIGLQSIIGVNQRPVQSDEDELRHSESHLIHGLAIASEWAMIHHQLEFELILGVITHQEETAELGKLCLQSADSSNKAS